MLYLPFVYHVLACNLRKTCLYENLSIRNTIHDFPNINFLSFSINFRPFVCYIFPENYHPEFIRPKTATIWSIYGDFRTFPRCLGEVVWRRSSHLRLVSSTGTVSRYSPLATAWAGNSPFFNVVWHYGRVLAWLSVSVIELNILSFNSTERREGVYLSMQHFTTDSWYSNRWHTVQAYVGPFFTFSLKMFVLNINNVWWF